MATAKLEKAPEINKIYQGNTLKVLQKWPDECVDTIITSPPYWGLRAYGKETRVKWIDGWYGQLGLEPTFAMFLDHMLQITAELKRVLKKTGSFYLNIGDTYYAHRSESQRQWKGDQTLEGSRWARNPSVARGGGRGKELPPKCLCGIPWRLALRMADEQGWIIRNAVIWNKPNAMPSSVKDRLSNTYEFIFHFVKNNEIQYYYNIKTGLMQSKKPLGVHGKEGIDWEWKDQTGLTDEEWKKYAKKKGLPFTDRKARARAGLDLIKRQTKIPQKEAESFGSPRGRYHRAPERKKRSLWRSLKYFYDLDAIRKPISDVTIARYGRGFGSPKNKYIGQDPAMIGGAKIDLRPKELKGLKKKEARQILKEKGVPPGQEADQFRRKGHSGYYDKQGNLLINLAGKNPGDVWKIATQPFPEAHFATFPEKLIIPMIKSSCPKWVCKKCGKTRVRRVEGTSGQAFNIRVRDVKKGRIKHTDRVASKEEIKKYKEGKTHAGSGRKTVGWTDCNCKAGWEAGIVLDPFIGSGTTALVARKLARNWLGIELSKNYIKIAEKRLQQQTLGI